MTSKIKFKLTDEEISKYLLTLNQYQISRFLRASIELNLIKDNTVHLTTENKLKILNFLNISSRSFFYVFYKKVRLISNENNDLIKIEDVNQILKLIKIDKKFLDFLISYEGLGL